MDSGSVKKVGEQVMRNEIDSEAAEAEKKRRQAVLRNAAIGVVLLPLLFALDFTYQMLTKGPEGIVLIEVFTVPFDLILLTVSLLVGASFEGHSQPRDWPWAALAVGIILIFFSGAIHTYMEYRGEQPAGQPLPVFWNNLLTVYVPDGIAAATLVWAIYGIRG
jgi:hypothetical protein